MNRRDFLKLTGCGAAMWAAAGHADAGRRLAGDRHAMHTPTRVISKTPPLRWEDAMISGNGSTGMMVMGLPLDETIIVNHEKCWVVGNDYRPEAPDLAAAWAEARKIAAEGRYRDADDHVVEAVRKIVTAKYADKAKAGVRPWYDRTHPAFHIRLGLANRGRIRRYRRQTNFATGEVAVSWTDLCGDWRRRAFVSRTHDAIVLELIAPVGEAIEGSLRLVEAPGKMDGDLGPVTVDHADGEVYFHAPYGRTMGRDKPEGYHALGRLIVTGGDAKARAGERVDVRGARRLLMILRFEYLDDATAGDRDALRKALAGVPADYDELLAAHAAVHGEMFRRVTLDFGGDPDAADHAEALLARSVRGESLAEFFALLFAAGRYATICGATGELAPTLMGIWGNEWTPPWDGRYTFDANVNLAISGASQGNLPEAMDTYAAFLERNLDDWRDNARKLYGCRGALTDLCQGWRHGTVLMATYPWTGGVGWLVSYLYDHYLFTRDREFLAEHVVPMLKDAADFYEDFTAGYPPQGGRVTFYPSISPENVPTMTPPEQACGVVPNATCEIAICREVLTNLLAACRELGIEKDNLPRWRALLDKLPDYVVNDDGALAEWAHPGLGDTYTHRHSSHLYCVWPAREASPERTPELFAAARRAMEKRLEAGLGNKAAHGFMHVSFVAARLRNPQLMWRMLRDFAALPFVNSSFITCHNPGPHIYNLDTTFAMPAVLMEMLLLSEPGAIEVLPAMPKDKFPRGTIRGMLARGGITVELLSWNLPLGRIHITLRSPQAQKITLRSGIRMRYCHTEDPADKDLLAPQSGRKGWQVELPADRSVALRFNA